MGDISIKKAATINFISKYSNIFIQLLINSILARLLTPDDYGVVTIITVFISLFTIIADMGVGPAIIQNKNLNKRQISDIFIFTFFIAIITSISFIVFSYPLSIFYNNKIYTSLGMILSIGIFFNILNIVPNALLLKDKQFKALGIRTIAITVIIGIITIILALNGAKYYALVINSVLVGFFTFIFNYFYSKLKIYSRFSFESVKEIRNFSKYQFGFNFINYFARNLDNLLIGRFMGQVPLGYYDKAYKLMLYPVQNLTYVITPVLHPILSDYQNNKDRIYDEYIKVFKILSLLGVFISIFCFWAAEEIILIMFGSQWNKSIECFRILSISIWFQITASSAGAIYQSIDNTKLMFKSGIIHVLVTITLIVLGVYVNSINYVATLVTISLILKFLIEYYILITKGFKRDFKKFTSIFIPEIIIAISMILLCSIFNIIKIDNIIFSVFYKFSICILTYWSMIILTKQKNYLSKIIPRKFKIRSL